MCLKDFFFFSSIIAGLIYYLLEGLSYKFESKLNLALGHKKQNMKLSSLAGFSPKKAAVKVQWCKTLKQGFTTFKTNLDFNYSKCKSF